MRFVTSMNKDCLAASLAMVLDKKMEDVKHDLFRDLERPWDGKWQDYPKVPDMNVVCDWAWSHRVALVPFEFNPQNSPHKDCPQVPVWPANTRTNRVPPNTPEIAFARHLRYGNGLLEGLVDGVGHMCAWNSAAEVVFDPRGYRYGRESALDKFDFNIRRFWLAVGSQSF